MGDCPERPANWGWKGKKRAEEVVPAQLLDLPAELLSQIASDLSLPEVIQFLSLNTTLHNLVRSPYNPLVQVVKHTLRAGPPYPRALAVLPSITHLQPNDTEDDSPLSLEILTRAEPKWILEYFEYGPWRHRMWEEAYARRFLPSWRKFKQKGDTWHSAFLRLLGYLQHRTVKSRPETHTCFMVLNDDGTAWQYTGAAASFEPKLMFNGIKYQEGLGAEDTEVRVVVHLQDVRILALGVLSTEHKDKINRNAHLVVHPPRLRHLSMKNTDFQKLTASVDDGADSGASDDGRSSSRPTPSARRIVTWPHTEDNSDDSDLPLPIPLPSAGYPHALGRHYRPTMHSHVYETNSSSRQRPPPLPPLLPDVDKSTPTATGAQGPQQTPKPKWNELVDREKVSAPTTTAGQPAPGRITRPGWEETMQRRRERHSQVSAPTTTAGQPAPGRITRPGWEETMQRRRERHSQASAPTTTAGSPAPPRMVGWEEVEMAQNEVVSRTMDLHNELLAQALERSNECLAPIARGLPSARARPRSRERPRSMWEDMHPRRGRNPRITTNANATSNNATNNNATNVSATVNATNDNSTNVNATNDNSTNVDATSANATRQADSIYSILGRGPFSVTPRTSANTTNVNPTNATNSNVPRSGDQLFAMLGHGLFPRTRQVAHRLHTLNYDPVPVASEDSDADSSNDMPSQSKPLPPRPSASPESSSEHEEPLRAVLLGAVMRQMQGPLPYRPIVRPTPAFSHQLYPNFTPHYGRRLIVEVRNHFDDSNVETFVVPPARDYRPDHIEVVDPSPSVDSKDDPNDVRMVEYTDEVIRWVGPMMLVAQLFPSTRAEGVLQNAIEGVERNIRTAHVLGDALQNPRADTGPIHVEGTEVNLNGTAGSYMSVGWEDICALMPWLNIKVCEDPKGPPEPLGGGSLGPFW